MMNDGITIKTPDFIQKDKTLSLIFKIFSIAHELSTQEDYSKADAYDGLATVLKCFQDTGSSNHSQETKEKIEEFIKLRDEINKNLNREKIYTSLVPVQSLTQHIESTDNEHNEQSTKLSGDTNETTNIEYPY